MADEKEIPESEEVDSYEWYEIRADLRNDIDTAIYVYNFLDEIDMQGADVLRWNMKRRLTHTKKKCLEIICKSIYDLQEVEEDKEEDED